MEIAWFFFQIIVGYNLMLPLVLYGASRIRRRHSLKLIHKEYDYAVIVTAYEETSYLKDVIDSILQLNYSNYLVYVVADHCDISHLHVDSEKVILLQPKKILANNVKSHFYAIQHFKRLHEVLTIIDSDNLVDPEYLNEFNIFFNRGFEAVQGLRKPKNLNTSIACLDAIRDVYYHFYDGRILFKLGSSATLSGSGMAFKTGLYKECLENIVISGAGFDKVLQAQIVKKDKRIAFVDKAVVYDEKTKTSSQLINQRSRWLNTWFKYFVLGFDLIWLGFKNRSLNQFLFGMVLVRPPLFMFLSFSLSCLLINIWLQSIFFYLWLLAFLVFLFSFYLAFKTHKVHREMYRSLLFIPKFVFFQILSLIFIRSANRRSVATKHQVDL